MRESKINETSKRRAVKYISRGGGREGRNGSSLRDLATTTTTETRENGYASAADSDSDEIWCAIFLPRADRTRRTLARAPNHRPMIYQRF